MCWSSPAKQARRAETDVEALEEVRLRSRAIGHRRLAIRQCRVRDLGIERRRAEGLDISRRDGGSAKCSGSDSPGSAQKSLSTHAAVYNTFNVQRHLTSA